MRGAGRDAARFAERADAAAAPGTGEDARALALVAALRTAGGAGPAPTDEFRAALRQRLLAVAAVQGIGETATAPAPAGRAVSWRQRAAAVTAGVLATAVAATGVSAAAGMSLPGDPFYGLKRTAEGVQLALAGDAAAEGERHLQFARTRLEEVRRLLLGRDLGAAGPAPDVVDPATAARVAALLADMDTETRTASRLLVAAFRDGGDAAPVERLAAFADTQRADLAAVLPVLPAQVRPAARASLALVAEVGRTAAELLVLRDCTGACDPRAAAPVLPPGPGEPASSCTCPTTPPAPSVAPVPSAASPAPSPAGTTSPPSPSPSPSESADPAPSATPSPTPSPTPLLPLPTPLPTLPLPTLPQDPLAPLAPLTSPGPVQVPVLPAAHAPAPVVAAEEPLVGGTVLVGLPGLPLLVLALRARRRR